jgi:hypothetical protein
MKLAVAFIVLQCVYGFDDILHMSQSPSPPSYSSFLKGAQWSCSAPSSDYVDNPFLSSICAPYLSWDAGNDNQS